MNRVEWTLSSHKTGNDPCRQIIHAQIATGHSQKYRTVLPRFRCRVGHAYGLNSLHEALANYVENSLWSSLQALQAKAEIEENLRQEAELNGDSTALWALKTCIDETQHHIIALAQMLKLPPAELAPLKNIPR